MKMSKFADLIVGVQPMSEEELRRRHPEIITLIRVYKPKTIDHSASSYKITFEPFWWNTNESKYDRAMKSLDRSVV